MSLLLTLEAPVAFSDPTETGDDATPSATLRKLWQQAINWRSSIDTHCSIWSCPILTWQLVYNTRVWCFLVMRTTCESVSQQKMEIFTTQARVIQVEFPTMLEVLPHIETCWMLQSWPSSTGVLQKPQMKALHGRDNLGCVSFTASWCSQKFCFKNVHLNKWKLGGCKWIARMEFLCFHAKCIFLECARKRNKFFIFQKTLLESCCVQKLPQ